MPNRNKANNCSDSEYPRYPRLCGLLAYTPLQNKITSGDPQLRTGAGPTAGEPMKPSSSSGPASRELVQICYRPFCATKPVESQSKPGTMVVIPEPCKELRRRPQLFMAGIVPYQPLSTRVLIVAQLGKGFCSNSTIRQGCRFYHQASEPEVMPCEMLKPLDALSTSQISPQQGA